MGRKTVNPDFLIRVPDGRWTVDADRLVVPGHHEAINRG